MRLFLLIKQQSMNRQNIITIIISTAAIIVAGFTWFRNPDQAPQSYGTVLPIEKHIKMDTLEALNKNEVFHVWKVTFMRPVKYTVAAKGLPTYDTLMINEPFSRYVLQAGADFKPELFLEHTHRANRVVDWTLIR